MAGEGFEDLLAGAWSDLGYNVLLAPRSYDGADAHVELQNNWVALSMKSEARAKPSSRTIRLTSVAPHHVAEFREPKDCRLAVMQALAHLQRYDRMIYLLSTEETFPGSDERAHRYTLLELPERDLTLALAFTSEAAWTHPDLSTREVFQGNTLTAWASVPEPNGFSCKVTISKRPPRVTLSGIDFSRCRLIASYWTEPIASAPRLNRDDVMSGRFTGRGNPRFDVVDTAGATVVTKRYGRDY